MRYLLFSVLFLLALGTKLPARAETAKTIDLEFPQAAAVGEQTVPLRGTYKYEYWGFDVYSLAFYAPEEANSMDEILDGETPRKLVLRYHRTIKAEDLAKATREIIAKNPDYDEAEFQEELDKVCEAYKTVREDDRYEVYNLPETGMELYLNGEFQIRIDNPEFSGFFFGIWVSDHGIKDEMGRELRGE